MAFYNLKKKPALTTKEGETETMYADIVYSGTIPAERLIRGVAKRTEFQGRSDRRYPDGTERRCIAISR